ncbi:MAG TPA: DUF302 domain-containing protein [Acidobacteriaceae bacterium]|nr:DUF302 domain-containing protein [Acidobacteriaceae bacterium]
MMPHAVDGIVHLSCPYPVEEALKRLEKLLQARGIPILARIDHSAAAAQAGMIMPSTELIIFGNAKAGTPLMLAAPTVAIDLPLKALVWQDAEAKVWISYNTPEYLQRRHSFPEELMKNITAIRSILEEAVR